MKQSTVKMMVCPECRGTLSLTVFEKNSKEILEGYFTCKECKSWYPVKSGIPNMLPEHLTDAKDREIFKLKWKIKDGKKSSTRLDPEKQKQIDFYNEDCDHYDENLEMTPFWRANDWNCIRGWVKKVQPGQLMLDIGCGTGRASFPFARRGLTVMAFDISEGMVTRAREKAKRLGLNENMEYMVGDAENPPFKEESFDRVIVFGVLHHVPDPRKVLGSIRRMLKPNGMYFGHENNKSALRGLFDFSMKLSKLWNEEAGNHPLISESEIKRWGRQAGLKVKARTSVFVLPHVYNWVGYKNAKTLMSTTDSFFLSLPVLKHHGGALIIEARRL